MYWAIPHLGGFWGNTLFFRGPYTSGNGIGGMYWGKSPILGGFWGNPLFFRAPYTKLAKARKTGALNTVRRVDYRMTFVLYRA